MTSEIHRSSSRLWWLVCLTLVSGCGGGGRGHKLATRGQAGTRQPGEALAGHPQVGVLHLPAGHSSARFTITALSPPHHEYDVQIVAPASANVAVRIHTWYGTDLGVTYFNADNRGCTVRGTRLVCALLFPLLEAQRAGPWTVIATKRSRSPATVRIAVTFSRACNGAILPPCQS